MTAAAGEQQQNNDQGAGNGNQGASERTFSQAEVNSLVAKERREVASKFEGFDDLKDKAAKFDQLTATTQSETQTLNDKLSSTSSERDTLKTTNAKLQTQLDRQRISATQGLDPELWDRVKGTTAEEIEADVKKLVEKFGTGKTTTVIGSRSGSGASATDARTAKERAAAAFRQLGSQ